MLSLVDSDIHIAHHWDGNDIHAITGYIVTLVNLEHTDLSLLLQHNFNCQGVKHNFLSLADGKLLMHLTNKAPKVKQIDSIEIWTDAFCNNVNVMID
jgi:hypothetical protein